MNGLFLVDYDSTYFDLSKVWLMDSELNHLIHAGTIPSDEERAQWFQSLKSRTDYLIWGVEYNGEPVGVCGLKKILDGQAEYWGYIGEKNLWGKGLGKTMMAEIFRKAKDLNINRVYLRVRKYNPRAYKMYLKIGFVVYEENDEVYCMSIGV